MNTLTPRWGLTALLLTAILAAGCGAPRYLIKVNGYTDPAAPVRLTPAS